ncbi:hypothetical protein [Afipia felis]|uniref:Uncharacterized protein n=2 Tax=Afipia felis TaxID=1035 RepID=A0A380W7F1_AFIFE|nr:hypothetical protein [Afipia felis]EKS28098.1 hypothetical protein HMPREF9697_00626 [Afipia felis ATCC 53690]SUU76808.1 Uncharacterised protein [Afipia felis]SUU84874.1 Uncharacterised protein [Afipia felis]
MKLLGTIIIAAIVAALLGGVVAVALSSLVACWQAGCALSGMQQFMLTPFYAGLGAVVFVVAATRKQWREAMFYALRLLMLVPVVLIVVGLAAGNSPRAQIPFQLGSAVLLSIPFWVVIISQWWMVRRALVSREAAQV